jgi:hypothetical protein
VAPAVLIFFQIIQTNSNLEIEKECITLPQNSQILHAARLGHFEQLSQLCRHQILKIIRGKNPGTDPPFESLTKF